MKPKAVKSKSLSGKYESRYVLIDEETGKVLDDAQGYGFKTPQAAHTCYAYKHRDKSKDKEKASKRKHIKEWLNEHKDFVDDMEYCIISIAKGSCSPDEKFDAAFVRGMLKQRNLEIDFSVRDLLNVWKNL